MSSGPESGNGLRASLMPPGVSLAPGGRASVDVTVFNGTGVVDEFELSLVGGQGVELQSPPGNLSLFPGDEDAVKLQLVLPADAEVGAGQSVVGVKVQSMVHPEVVWVEELEVNVVPVTDVAMRLEPQSLTGGAKGSVSVIITNRGTSDAAISLRGEDPESVVKYEFTPQQQTIGHHEEATVRMRVAAPRRFAGSNERRTLNVRADGPGVEAAASGVFVQRPRLPAIVTRAALFLLGIGVVFGLLFVTGVLPPESSTTTIITTTTTVVVLPATIEFFTPGPVNDDGCVELAWQVVNAETVRLDTPRDGSAVVEPEDSRTVCGSDGDSVTLTATGADGQDKTAVYPIAFELAVGDPQVTQQGRTIAIDVVTNQPATVELSAGEGTDTSSGGTNHHLEVDDLPSGPIDWDLVASAPGQLDVTVGDTITIPYYYGQITLIDGPSFESATTTTPPPTGTLSTLVVLVTGSYRAFSTDPVTRFLGIGCTLFEDEAVETLIVPLELDGSGGASLAVVWCSAMFVVGGDPQLLEDVDTDAQPCALEPGFDAETVECLLEFPQPTGSVTLTLRLERLTSLEEPAYS